MLQRQATGQVQYIAVQMIHLADLMERQRLHTVMTVEVVILPYLHSFLNTQIQMVMENVISVQALMITKERRQRTVV